MKRTALVLSMLACALPFLRAQTSDTPGTADAGAETLRWGALFEGGGSTGEWAPSLIGSNSGGRHAMKGTAAVSAIVRKDYNLERRFSWTAGVELSAGYQSSATYERYDAATSTWGTRRWHPAHAIVYQLWGGVKYRGVMLWAGMRDHRSTIVNDRLSSGDVVLSNNARAIPQIAAGFIDFQNIPFTKGWVQIIGTISYGKYTDSDALEARYNYWTRHITLGQLFTYKNIYFRTRTDVPLSVTVGVQNAGEFGGTVYDYSRGKQVRVEKNGQDLRSFWEMFIPSLRSRDAFVEGNQLGSWDLKARYRLRGGIDLEGYFQWFWEDGSSMGRRNMTDGLWGVSVTLPGAKRALKTVVAEYIDFRDQSGPIHWAPFDSPGTTITTEATGGDNYYNSTNFNAWANYGLGLGSAFPKAPLYNGDGYPQFKHNRTRGLWIGASGWIGPAVEWTAKVSHAVAWGMGRIPYPDALKNTSAFVDFRWDASLLTPGLAIGAQLAFDAGDLRGDNFGALVSVSYSGSFPLRKK